MHEQAQRAWVTRHDEHTMRPARAVSAVLGGGIGFLVAVAVAITADLPIMLLILVVIGMLVLAAILARHTVGALAAGAGLRIARPYCPGECIRLHVPSLGSVVDAEIVHIGPVNTTLLTSDRLVVVPNSHMLRPSRG